ncbi:MAG: M67 family metallopeptidase [Oscillospiraceae bacterium]|nr:M67 family metallopeptidase [Oscillospiraceae bacterium]
MIRLQKTDYLQILSHARACLPEEACGLLAGRCEGEEARVEAVYLLENADHSPTHFTIAPQEQLKAILDMRARGLELLGNWHSHPETPSRPSAEDVRLALDPTASYLILSLAENEPVLRSFRIMDGRAEQEELQIEE